MRPLLMFAVLSLSPVAALADAAGAVVPQPPLAEFVAAFPRIAGKDAATQAINARLQQLDDGAGEMLDCDLSRELRITLDSPAFLSLTANEGGYCEGAAHPFFVQYGLTFDRTTGLEVDWSALLPETLLQTQTEGYDPDAPFASAALNAAYLAALDPELASGECKEVYDMGLRFQFWMEAGKGIAMVPDGLPHAVLACSEVVVLSLDSLRAAGMNAASLAAIETGRADAP